MFVTRRRRRRVREGTDRDVCRAYRRDDAGSPYRTRSELMNARQRQTRDLRVHQLHAHADEVRCVACGL